MTNQHATVVLNKEGRLISIALEEALAKNTEHEFQLRRLPARVSLFEAVRQKIVERMERVLAIIGLLKDAEAHVGSINWSPAGALLAAKAGYSDDEEAEDYT